ncbi:MAG: hypothetical protein AABY94_05440, partial [Nitrospirota bacterium]
ESSCQISPKAYPWNDVMGVGETPNKAAADFEDKWKTKGLAAEMYSGPSWEGGIKPEKPAPPKPAAPPKPVAAPAAPGAASASQPTASAVPVAPAVAPTVPPPTAAPAASPEPSAETK